MTLARYTIPVAACAVLSLAACGGGGGGGSTTTAQTPADPPQSSVPPRQSPEPSPEPPASPPDPIGPGAAGDDPDRELRAARAAATAVPRFEGIFAELPAGGVTLSTNVDSRRATTDLAVATFSGGRLLAVVERQGKSDLFIDSDDATSRPSGGSSSYGVYWSGDWMRFGGVSCDGSCAPTYSGDTRTSSIFSVHYSASDPTDWLAMGKWRHTDRSRGTTEVGVFVDGPGFRESPSSLPIAGTATYSGLASGDFYGRAAGETVTDSGGFTGGVDLTADFARDSIVGCVGCDSDFPLETVATDSFDGIRFRIHLPTATFGARGVFQSGGVTISSSDLSARGVGVASQNGNWGGRFSRWTTSGGLEPRAVAAAFGSSATWSDGGETIFVGAFHSQSLPPERSALLRR